MSWRKLLLSKLSCFNVSLIDILYVFMSVSYACSFLKDRILVQHGLKTGGKCNLGKLLASMFFFTFFQMEYWSAQMMVPIIYSRQRRSWIFTCAVLTTMLSKMLSSSTSWDLGTRSAWRGIGIQCKQENATNSSIVCSWVLIQEWQMLGDYNSNVFWKC